MYLRDSLDLVTFDDVQTHSSNAKAGERERAVYDTK